MIYYFCQDLVIVLLGEPSFNENGLVTIDKVFFCYSVNLLVCLFRSAVSGRYSLNRHDVMRLLPS